MCGGAEALNGEDDRAVREELILRAVFGGRRISHSYQLISEYPFLVPFFGGYSTEEGGRKGYYDFYRDI